MTALTSAYISVTGLLSFSRALDVIGDNVANLNTVGFKATDVLFESLPSGEGSREDDRPAGDADVPGSGATVGGTRRRFTAGELRETGTATHLAVDGNGFFVLRDGAVQAYTRSGQFQLDVDGYLVDGAGRRVQSSQSGDLHDVRIDRNKTNPPTPTTLVNLAGTLSVGQQDGKYSMSNVKLFDADGLEKSVTIEFERSTSTAASIVWTVTVKSAEGTTLKTADIGFEGSGAPANALSTVKFNLPASGGRSSEVTLDFGQPGSQDGVRSLSAGTASTLQVRKSDGYGLGSLTDFSFDSKGLLTLRYSNGQTETAPRLALADFSDQQRLQSADGVVFTAAENVDVRIGLAGEGGFGSLRPRSLELANVELAREFADILILQRGFQASSQVLNVTSQMIEDIYNSVGGR